MPKKIVKKSTNGIISNYSNTGRLIAGRDEILINDNELERIYEKYVSPFINESPFKMGSMDRILTIYNNINNVLKFAPSGTARYALLVFRDITTVLVRSQHIYYDNLSFSNQLETLRIKYNLSERKVIELTGKILELEKSNKLAKGVFTGSLGIKLTKLPNLIYAQALLNLDFAWYQYLHNTAKFDPILMNSTKNYVCSLGTQQEAYDKLIAILDERFKDIDDVIDDTIDNN
jgi:hypothetical protein